MSSVFTGQADGRRGGQPEAGRKWAVCCSGGGIRSASFCLGGLQALQQGGLLDKTGWILGVSGGSYVASARALVAHGPGKDAHAGAASAVAVADGRAGTGQPPAYAAGTPEERSLRNNTHYLAPTASVVLAGILSLLAGVVVTFVLVFAPLYALTHAWGWLLRWQAVLAPSPQHALAVTVQPWMWILPAVAAMVTLLLFVWWRATLMPRSQDNQVPGGRDRESARAATVGWGAVITMTLAVMTLGVPFAAAWLFTSSGAIGDSVHFFGFGKGISWTPAALAGLIAAVAAIARSCQTALAKFGLQDGGGLIAQVGRWLRQRLLPWLGSALVILVALACAVLWIGDGARAGFTLTQLWPVLIALAVMLLTRLAADVNRMSLHDFYRWRLASAYAVTRTASAGAESAAADGTHQTGGAASGVDPDPAALLSALADKHDKQPELVICATANINAARQAPPGQNGFCLTFDPSDVILHREEGSTVPSRVAARTSDYEQLVGPRRLTLFDISAISGAAFSPLMGSATRQAYRIMLTVANLRLGVWLPHPQIVRDARQHIDRHAQMTATSDGGRPQADQQGNDIPQDSTWWAHHPLLLLLWYLSPHPRWAEQAALNEEREKRLWAHVLDRRRNGRGAVWYWAMQPTLGLLWAEAVGRTSYRSTWLYATDGGHYDNLGLVEALRRGAEHIIVLDASGDKADTWFTLGAAMALARADQGVEINLDPTTMISPYSGQGHELQHGEVVRPWAHGTFTRQNGYPGLPGKGDIWVCKLGWWRQAPWDVRAYAAGHPEYPGESTAEQLYDGTEFEAYRELGTATVLDAARHGTLPLSGMGARVALHRNAVRILERLRVLAQFNRSPLSKVLEKAGVLTEPLLARAGRNNTRGNDGYNDFRRYNRRYHLVRKRQPRGALRLLRRAAGSHADN